MRRVRSTLMNWFSEDDGLTLGGYSEFIAELGGRKVVYKIEDDASASRSSFALMDCSKIKRIGWTPMFTVKEGLEKTYKIKCNL